MTRNTVRSLFFAAPVALGIVYASQAIATTFTNVIGGQGIVLNEISLEERNQYQRWANEFAKYHAGKDLNFLRTCSQDAHANPLCSLAISGRLNKNGSSRTLGISKLTRTSFFKAVSALDDETKRFENCKKSTPALQQILRTIGASRLAPRALYWLWICANEDLYGAKEAELAADKDLKSILSEISKAQDDEFAAASAKQLENVQKLKSELEAAEAKLAEQGPNTSRNPVPAIKAKLEVALRPIDRNKLKIPSALRSKLSISKRKEAESVRYRKRSEAAIDVYRSELNDKYFFSFHHLLILTESGEADLMEIVSRKVDPEVAGVSKLGLDINGALRTLEALMQFDSSNFRLHPERRRAAEAVAQALSLDISSLEPDFRLYFSAILARFAEFNPSVLLVSRNLLPLLREHKEFIGRATLTALYPINYLVFDARKGAHITIKDLIEGNMERGYGRFIYPSLLAALMYQESGFNPMAKSRAGAIGIVQMLLSTAQEEWKLRGARELVTPDISLEQLFALPINESRLKFDLSRAILLGSGYFEAIRSDFKGSLALALASYNSGPTAIGNWHEKYKFNDQVVISDLVLMDDERELHASDYVVSVMNKAFWYNALYFSE